MGERVEIANKLINKIIQFQEENKGFYGWKSMSDWKYLIAYLVPDIDGVDKLKCFDESFLRSLFDIIYKDLKQFERTDNKPYLYKF